MKVFLDTNILCSAILYPGSIPDKALRKALQAPYIPVTSDYVLDELRRVFARKFPDKYGALATFLLTLVINIEVVKTDWGAGCKQRIEIRDIKDRPILVSAIESKCDYLISGDKDFLELSIDSPKIVSASDFYHKY